jgi:hypothetical protein
MRHTRALQDLDQEIREHIEQETRENIERGMSPEDARRAALRRFGNVTMVKEDARVVRRTPCERGYERAVMSDPGFRAMGAYREQIVGSLTPVRPLPTPSRRVWMLVPLGLLLAATAPLLNGQRGDLGAYTSLLTWGITGLQSLLGLWFLALGFREAVPGRNVSRRALTLASVLSALLVLGITFLTNAASATVVPVGREWQYWVECVIGPMVIGAPFIWLSRR